MMTKRNMAVSGNQDISERLSVLIDAAVKEIPGIEKIYLVLMPTENHQGKAILI
jgi:hypothetical protein